MVVPHRPARAAARTGPGFATRSCPPIPGSESATVAVSARATVASQRAHACYRSRRSANALQGGHGQRRGFPTLQLGQALLSEQAQAGFSIGVGHAPITESDRIRQRASITDVAQQVSKRCDNTGRLIEFYSSLDLDNADGQACALA